MAQGQWPISSLHKIVITMSPRKDYRPCMWYNTDFEAPQTVPVEEPANAQLVREGLNAVPQAPKAKIPATPGSEYWLP